MSTQSSLPNTGLVRHTLLVVGLGMMWFSTSLFELDMATGSVHDLLAGLIGGIGLVCLRNWMLLCERNTQSLPTPRNSQAPFLIIITSFVFFFLGIVLMYENPHMSEWDRFGAAMVYLGILMFVAWVIWRFSDKNTRSSSKNC